MAKSVLADAGNLFAERLERRAWHMVYRENEVNHCPGCGRSHWYIGSTTAECGFCATALPLTSTAMIGAGLFTVSARQPVRV
jgi:hypothetical protein